nr:MAG TPA: hypothetical protein [Caudoviricetes sp.]
MLACFIFLVVDFSWCPYWLEEVFLLRLFF